LNAKQLILLGESIAENSSLRTLVFIIESPIDIENFRRFSTAMHNNKTLKTIQFNLICGLPNNYILVLDSIKGLHVPTKCFHLEIYQCARSINSNEFYNKQVEVLSTTNVNKITYFERFSLFGITTALQGFAEFCKYIIKQNKLKYLKSCVQINDSVLPYMVDLISNTTSLRTLKLEFPSPAPSKIQDLLDALSANRNLRRLIIGGLDSTKEPEIWLKIATALRSMETLTSGVIGGHEFICADVEQFQSIIFGSESLRKFIFRFSTYETVENFDVTIERESELNEILNRNEKLQNTRVADLITILFNIARDTSSPSSSSAHIHSIPRDVWPSIASFVSIPGVNLDFGDIARSIFKDRTVRRVINKAVIMAPKRRSY
jgi:hypothetical protein